MRTVNLFIFLLMLLTCTFCTNLSAQQDKISIQSTLKDISGKAIPDGDVNVTFRLYHEMEQGQAEWTESAVVSVVGGIYSHKLGSITPLPASIFGLPLYLGVTVGGGQELIPRTELTASPFAISVRSLAGGGQSAAFEPNGTFNVSGNAQVNGNLHIQKPSSNTAWDLTIGGSNHGILRESNRLNIADNGTGRLLLFDSGLNQIHSSNGNGTELFVNGVQRFRTDGAGAITNGRHDILGNLALGTGHSLFMNSGNININGSGNLNVSEPTGSGTRWITLGDGDTGLRSTSDGRIAVMSNNEEVISVVRDTDGQRKVGINESNPKVSLVVNKTTGLMESSNWDGFHFGSGGEIIQGDQGVLTFNPAAYFHGGVVVSEWLASAQNPTFSDIRIKNVQGISDSKSDLNLLNKIKITDYTMIDKKTDNGTYKKVIAQDIQAIFPQATTKMRKAIPDLYCVSSKTKYEGEYLHITLDKKHQLVKGDKIDIFHKDGQNSELNVEDILDDHTFIVKSEKNLVKVFVYGKYVDDFLTVDYDALSMLNISATQELYKRLVELETENKALKTTTANLEDRMDRIEAMLSSNAADVIEAKTLAKK